jgi:hypothetical protein
LWETLPIAVDQARASVQTELGRVAHALLGSQVQDQGHFYQEIDMRRLYDVLLLTQDWNDDQWQALSEAMETARYGPETRAFFRQLSAVFAVGTPWPAEQLDGLLWKKFNCRRFDLAYKSLVSLGRYLQATAVEHRPVVAAGGVLLKVFEKWRHLARLAGAIWTCLRHRASPPLGRRP